MTTQIGLRFISVKYGRRVGGEWGGWGWVALTNHKHIKKLHVIKKHT